MAEKIQVILTEDVANLGKSGELVMVKPGYGRNYLIPQGLAVAATAKNVARIQHEKQIIELKAAKVRKAAEESAGKLAGVTVTIERSVGEGDKLFGSVTSKDVADALAAAGHRVDKKHIQLHEPLKALGEFPVDVKLGRDVNAQIKVVVAAKK
jgi:large subunit ribosomal protein L9